MDVNVDVLSKLMPNILTVAVQLCATFILFLILKKFAWGPAKKILDTRSAYEQERLQEAERLKKENEEMRAQMDALLEEADQKAQQTIRDAQIEGEKLRDSLVAEGKERSKQMMQEFQSDVEQQRAKMLDEVHDSIVDVAVSVMEKMLNEKLDSEADRQAVDDFIKEVAEK